MNTIPNPIGILAVDDHAIFRQGIISLLTDQPDMKLVAQGQQWARSNPAIPGASP